MRLDEARSLLGVSPADELEVVKSAYRRLAFTLHPDLHPNDPAAKRNFQRLNEAYLLLRHYYGNRDVPPGGSQEKQAPGAKERAKPADAGTDGPGAKAQRERQARQAYTHASKSNADTGFFFRREEVLQDLLKDPFARQVFEDIYRQVKSAPASKGPVRAKGREKSRSSGEIRLYPLIFPKVFLEL